jgi:hypothetical protein
LLEISRDHQLCGFGVISFPAAGHAVLMASFSERRPGARIEDRILAEAVQNCRDRQVRTLHLGYAGTDSLARFKRKWGATKTGPDYRDIIYCTETTDAGLLASNGFFWGSRMHATASRR